METLYLFIENIWSTTLDLSLWLLLGMLIAGILHVFVPDTFVKRHLGHKKGIWTVLKAVLFGVPMPLCSCGVIPAALGIKKQGAGDGAAIGFLISTPQTGVDSIMVSASMLGWPFAIFKLASAFVIGIIGGGWSYLLNSNNSDEIVEDDNLVVKEKRGIKDLFSFAIDDLLKMIWKWMIAGIFISAAITTWIPHDFFQNYLLDNIFISMLVVLIISLPMYVCATASVPIAAALVATGMPPGAALVFLIAGPASNIATIGAVYRAFGMKKLIAYLTSIIIGSMIGGYFFNSLITPVIADNRMPHHESGGIVAIIAAIVFILLILRFIVLEIKEKFKKNAMDLNEVIEEKTIVVNGMTCEGCVASLRKALLAIPEISYVSIELQSGKVKIAGSNIDDELIVSEIKKSGFSVEI